MLQQQAGEEAITAVADSALFNEFTNLEDEDGDEDDALFGPPPSTEYLGGLAFPGTF